MDVFLPTAANIPFSLPKLKMDFCRLEVAVSYVDVYLGRFSTPTDYEHNEEEVVILAREKIVPHWLLVDAAEMSKAVPMCREEQPGEDKGSDDSCLIDDLREDIEALFLSPHLSDVTFVVQGERIYGHRLLLAARCDYFRGMFYGRMKESSEAEIRLEVTNALAFRTILRYIYTSRVEVSAFEVEELLAILRLAHEYWLVNIQRAIVDCLKTKVDINNVFSIRWSSVLLSDELTERCMQFADQHTSEVLASQEFLALDQKVVEEMLSRDSFCAPEIDIFKAICEWIRAQPSTEGATKEGLVESFISKRCLRLDLIKPEELLSTVRHSALFEANSSTLEKFILDALERRCKGTVSDIRGPAVLDQNVATAELGAVVVEGENKETLLSRAQGSTNSTSLTRHRIGQPEGIVVQLGRPYTINSVTLEIGNSGEDTNFSYKVEVSIDLQHWQEVANYSGSQSFPVKGLVFSARLVRYIRVLGSRSKNEYFSLVSFNALFSKREAKLDSLKVYARRI